MKLKSIKLTNFRNYEDIYLELSSGINILIGDNASGKTNILEAIYVLSLTKSPKPGIDIDLIKIGQNNLKISGEVIYNGFSKNYQVSIDKYKKCVYINNNQIKKISDYISNFCITSFLPNDIEVIKGSPSIRRNLLNIQIGQLYNNYLLYVNEYNHLLKLRNNYLKNSNFDVNFLNVINQKMIEVSLKIYYFRFLYISEINKIIPNVMKRLSGIPNLKIEYINNLGIDNFDEVEIRKILINKWSNNLNKEIMQGMTLYGLHRDDLLFLLGDKDVKIYASQGQQRLTVIAYKICELLVFKKIKGEYPVLLLDDVFSEIDIKKRNNIIKFLNNEMQVVITTTDINDISDDLVKDARIFKIKNGEIKEKGKRTNGRKSKD